MCAVKNVKRQHASIVVCECAVMAGSDSATDQALWQEIENIPRSPSLTSSLKPQSDSGLSPAAVTGNITAASATAAMFYLENPYNKNDAEERRLTHQRLSKQYQRLEGEEASESVKFKIISSIKDNPPQLHLSRLKLRLHE